MQVDRDAGFCATTIQKVVPQHAGGCLYEVSLKSSIEVLPTHGRASFLCHVRSPFGRLHIGKVVEGDAGAIAFPLCTEDVKTSEIPPTGESVRKSQIGVRPANTTHSQWVGFLISYIGTKN